MFNNAPERDSPPLDRRVNEVADAIDSEAISFKDMLRGAAGDMRRDLFSQFPHRPSLTSDFPKPVGTALDFSEMLKFRSTEICSAQTCDKIKDIVDTFIEQNLSHAMNEFGNVATDCQHFDLQKQTRIFDSSKRGLEELYKSGESKNALAYAEGVLSIATRMYVILPKDVLLDVANSPMLRMDYKVLEEKLHKYYGMASQCIDLINLMTAPQTNDRDTMLESRVSTFGEGEFAERSYRMQRLSSTSEDDCEQLWGSINELLSQAQGTSLDHLASKINLLGDITVAIIEHLSYVSDNYTLESSVAGDQALLKRALHCLVFFMQNLATFYCEIVNGHAMTHQLINGQAKLTEVAAQKVNEIKLVLTSPEATAGNEAIQYQGSAFHDELTRKLSMFDWIDTQGSSSSFFNDKLKFPELIKKFTGMNVEVQVIDGMGMPYANLAPPPLNANHPYIRNRDKYFFTMYYQGEMFKHHGQKVSSTVNFSTGQVDGWYSEVPFVLSIAPMFYWEGYTAREVSAIFLHELGHAFMFLCLMNRRMADFNVMDNLVRRLADVKDKFTRRDMITYDLRSLGIEVTDQDRMTSDEYNGEHSGTLACALYIDGSMNHTSVAEEKYSIRINEQLADQFAIAHGAGADLAAAVFRYGKEYDVSSDYNGRFTYWVAQVVQFFFVVLLPVSFPLVLMTVWMDAKADDMYDEPLKRIELMRRSIIGQIKRYKNDPRMTKRLAEDAERIRQIEKMITSRQTVFMFLTKLLVPSRRRIIVTAKKHANIERIIGNDLFLSHTRFN